MTDLLDHHTGRRAFIVGGAATGALALSGCAGLPGFGFTDAIRRLLLLSSERAFARLTADGGFWDQQVGRIGLANIMGTRGNILAGILTSAVFKDQLEDAFADVAIRGAERAAPLVADAVRIIGIQAAEQLVRGGPTAATSFLRGEMGTSLVEAMVPELGDAIRLASDPVIGRAISRLSGVDVAGVSNRFSGDINNAIWNEMGVEEAEIRRNPRGTNDPVLIGVFGTAGL
ncbi:DUF4197 domain-containing protein [Pontixanthobacter aestiaquae]|uniref:DUF4197 family protein n=1 Tax=Pontixanthobacter aestiaquae TaxID=1509367 RepID=A0A844Z9T6_9SPHN|nr:DUF4197 domain-containing protein [Pontixanthobacter aestiaquae]MDN3644917.1 DUF4197 domain-containing protein [Pontixanthobacter aestiaquae]MXO84082.1 DUF4197 family protein [Pontixanthobacter aestiaquae]